MSISKSRSTIAQKLSCQSVPELTCQTRTIASSDDRHQEGPIATVKFQKDTEPQNFEFRGSL